MRSTWASTRCSAAGPLRPAATPAQVRAYQAEQRRRTLNLLALTALGRESQGRVDLALKAYRELYDTAGAQ